MNKYAELESYCLFMSSIGVNESAGRGGTCRLGDVCEVAYCTAVEVLRYLRWLVGVLFRECDEDAPGEEGHGKGMMYILSDHTAVVQVAARR